MQLEHLINAEFKLDADITYLNHAAVAPWPARTARALADFAHENVTRGARDYQRWTACEASLRERLAALVNAPDAQDIALARNTSEALSTVAHGLPWQAGDNVVISDREFPSNRIVWESLGGEGVKVREASLGGSDPEGALIAAMDGDTRLLSVSAVQYGTGLKLDLERLGEACRRRNVLFCIDAIQAVGAVALDVQAARADFMMADGHKWMLGPEGVALFYSRPPARERLKLHQFGWHMVAEPGNFDRREWASAPDARRFECGSPNMAGIHALAASVSLLLEVGMPCVAERVRENSRALGEMIERSRHLSLLSDRRESRLSGIVTFRHEKLANDVLHRILTDHGVVCAARGGGIRFSPHFHTPADALERAVEWADRARAPA